jgi:predicted acylesterase/phospholipase RssA
MGIDNEAAPAVGDRMLIGCVDGGGIKGILTARLMERLESMCPGWVARTDLFAGTSTGGIIALALASGMTPAECVELYRENGKVIFASRGIGDALSGGLDELVRADYAQDGLRSVLEKTFGDKKLADLNKRVLIPALDLRRWGPKFFDREHDGDLRVVDVALATSSAPTYLPSHGWATGKDVTCYADGGLFANNPSDSALAYVAASTKYSRRPADTRMLSFGTGASSPPPPKGMLDGDTQLDWGHNQWILSSPHYLLAALFDGTVAASHFRSKQQLGDHYCRVQPDLTCHVELDAHEKIPDLLVAADRFPLDDVAAWIIRHWN